MEIEYFARPLGMKYCGRRPEGTITLNGELLYELSVDGERTEIVNESSLNALKGNHNVNDIVEKFKEWDRDMQNYFRLRRGVEE